MRRYREGEVDDEVSKSDGLRFLLCSSENN